MRYAFIIAYTYRASINFRDFPAETWYSILFTVLVEIVPADLRSGCIGIFNFFMNNVGGNLPVLVEVVKEWTDYRTSLLIFYAGFVGASKSSG